MPIEPRKSIPAPEGCDEFFMVYNMSCGPHSPTFRHATKGSAETEAMRLAAANPGSTFVVLQSITSAHAPKPVPTLHPVGIPF